MTVTATLLAFVVYLVVPTVLAATTYSRASLDLERAEPNVRSLRTGRKISEIDFPTNLEEIPQLPVVQLPFQGLFFGKPNVMNGSRKPYKTIPVRRGRQGAPKGTQSIPDLVNDLVFDEKTPLVILTRAQLRPRVVPGPFADRNGLGR